MPGITSYGNSCKTKQTYENDGFTITEEIDGTIGLYDPSLNPVTFHETKPCCELLGYTFDIETQKCRWALDNEELFKVVLNPDGNASTLFDVDTNETCSLEISFDYLFAFNCDDLIEAKARVNGVSVSTQIQIDELEAEINNLTIECDFYQNIIDNASEIPYVIECLAPGVTGPAGTTLPSDPSLYYGGNLPPSAYGEFDPNVVNYCLTVDGLAFWQTQIGNQNYTTWLASNGSDTSMYDCDDVKALVEAEIQPGAFYTETCDYNIYDRAKAQQTISDYTNKLAICEAEKLNKETQLNTIRPNNGSQYYYNPNDKPCGDYINMIEEFDTAFTLEILDTTTNKLISVYEEPLLNIGSGNLYDYIDSTSGKTGILISGDTGLMPTLAETDLFGLSADLCSQVRDVLVTDLFNQYLEDNELPTTQQEQIDIFTKLTGWYQSCWLQFKTTITDETVLSLIENEKINITISIKNSCLNFSILLDRIKMNKMCTKVDNVERFISEPPKFELTKVPDNKKSWLSNTTPDERFFDLKYRGTEYDTNHHRLVINTKEVDLNLSPSRAVEQDVWCYVADNNCILEGCLSEGETYSAFTCPSGYTLDTDGDSCTKLTTTGATSSATTYTVGPGVGLSNSIHYLSRGVIFVEDVTDNEWPIYWTGTSKNTWVGPYYNTDYLTDSSGKALMHTGFGTNKFSDGSIQYSSPDAFSGIKSRFGQNSSDTINGKFNPNILWGGTSSSVSASTFNNVTGSNNAGRLLNASVWSNPGTLPVQEWIGLSYCFTLSETKIYRIGFAGDDNVRIKINGEYLINPDTTPDFDADIHKNFSISYSRTIQAYVVMGIKLSAGKNIIEIEGYNTVSGMAGFVCEIYDATEAQLKNIRYESELASVRVFSTLDRVGSTFDLGELSAYSCPSGYGLDNCGSVQCTKIERVTREDEQLDEYCPCDGFPLIVKDYSDITTELPLTASTRSFDCSEITALVANFGSTTTIEPVEVIKGGRAFALGDFTTTGYFDDFWITEENDGTIGLYSILWWPSSAVNQQDNVSNQIDATCCQIINDAFEQYANTYNQGINTYPSMTWDENRKKCVYSKCGDSGCLNLDDLLTTELSQIDTVKEFASTITSELIDVKNRQTISAYPTLRMLYDRYNTRSEEFCGILSSKFDYLDMDKFGKTVGDYWIDLIEQVVPATTIWGSTYSYKNTVFDRQKFNYKSSNLYLCDNPSADFPFSAISTDSQVSVITEELGKNKPLTTTGTTIGLVSLQPTRRECNGVWVMDKTCGVEFLGTVKERNNNTGIITGV